MRQRFCQWLLVCTLLVIVVPSSHAAPGDYEGDGKSDLAVALVRASTKTTEWLVRLSSSGNSLFFNFNLPADALITGRFYPDRKTYPGIVYVRSSGMPLEWHIKNPQGGETFLHYGLPGDIVPNQADVDCDGVTDLVVVRNGTANHYPGFRLWYAALSGSGAVVETAFGLATDAVGLADLNGDSCAELLVLREGFSWFGRGLFSNSITQRQWGLNGDIPLLPKDLNKDGKPDFIISRLTGSGQVAYVRTSASNFLTLPLGQDTSIPLVGKFTKKNGFAWFQRDTGFAAIEKANGVESVLPFGVKENVIIRPDGTVIQPNSTGKFPVTAPPPSGGDTSSCSSVLSSGWLLKPASQDSGGTRQGKPLILFSSNYPSSSCLNVLAAANGEVIAHYGRFSANRFYSGYGCGSGYSASQLAQRATEASGSKNIFLQDPSTGRCYGPGPADGRTDRR